MLLNLQEGRNVHSCSRKLLAVYGSKRGRRFVSSFRTCAVVHNNDSGVGSKHNVKFDQNPLPPTNSVKQSREDVQQAKFTI